MIKAWGITDRGAVRHQNQDAYYLDVPDEGLALAVVCDGMGGAKAGNVASTLAVDAFVEALRSGNIDAQEPDEALAGAAELANRAVFDRAGSDPACQGMGTTMVAALVSGTLTAVAMLYAKEVAAPEQTARAISLVYGGFSVAAVLGVPLGTAVCQWLGWRWTFAVILVMGAALLPLLLRSLPAVPPRREPGGLLKSFVILRDPRCSLCVGMILCSACATYVVYTYLSPILTDTLGLPEGAVSPLLLVMGACSAASNLLSGALGERGGLRTLPWAFAAQTALFALLPVLLGSLWTGLAGIFAMGLLMYLLNTPAQMHALSLAERDYPFAASLCASVQPVSYNFGIAAGSFIGSAVQEGWGFRALGAPAAVSALAALGLNLLLLRACRRRERTAP